jgi:hypothetical protein
MQKPWLIVRRPASADHSEHVAPSSWLGELVGCPCGHGIGRHTAQGCDGDYRGSCSCGGNASDVLGMAVRAAREECELELSRGRAHAQQSLQ